MCTIRDTGAGLPVDDPDKIFEPFFTTKANGMGMGLTISRTIVESHGGRLWATQNPQGGAAFRFTLPVGAKDNARTIDPRTAEPTTDN